MLSLLAYLNALPGGESTVLSQSDVYFIMQCLGIGNLQVLSSSLGVQVLVVVSGSSPDVPHDHTRNDDEQCLVLGSSESVEDRVVQSTLQRLGSVWRHRVDGNILLGLGADVAPPAHVSLWRNSSHGCWMKILGVWFFLSKRYAKRARCNWLERVLAFTRGQDGGLRRAGGSWDPMSPKQPD